MPREIRAKGANLARSSEVVSHRSLRFLPFLISVPGVERGSQPESGRVSEPTNRRAILLGCFFVSLFFTGGKYMSK